MAEFKLGRIRFVWKGTWTPATSYVVDDVISNGGKSYICVINHTASAAFATDQGANPPKWNLVSDGTSWRGDWATSTYYNLGDLVKYGGIVYICKTVHTSAATVDDGLEIDQAKWDAFATSYIWTGAWATDTKYRVNDFVQYGGVVYLCTTGHISDASATNGLEADIANWTTFNEGITYLGTWSASSVRYKLNDVVKYGADLWICVTPHVSSATFDDAKFEIFVNGLQFEDSWSDATVYQVGDVVTYGGYAYIAKTNHSNISPTDPVDGDTNWDLFTTGFSFQGEWNDTTAYKLGDVVRRGGYTYIAILDGTNQSPPNPTYWEVLNTGVKFISTLQTYTGVSGTNLSGTGTSAAFNITRTGTVYTVTVPGGSTGTGYADGNQIKILGSQVGGITPANDLIITVGSSTGGAINTVNHTGISVTWTSGNTYILGDVIMWGVSSYICVSAHVATNGNRPDADVSATHWNLLAGGSEPAVLTTQGDMFYYSANGPQRLPIGIDGQVLRVTNGYPEWDFYGLVNNVVYVAPTGEDGLASEGWGQTVDKPWKSVRYACQQVEDGYQNKQAQELLVKNKQFVMKEITSWITDTYTVAITGSNNVNNSFITADTSTLVANMPFKFDGTVGGVTAGTTYYIKQVLSVTEFSVSETIVSGVAGPTKNLVAATANMNGSLSYDSTKCERDVGIIVDAIAFDISHGGNLKTVEAAKSYYTPAGSAYITSNFGYQAIQTAAAYTYLTTLLGDVLANTAPLTNYQSSVGVVDPALQIIDTSLTAEAGVSTKVGTLVNIITNGILGESATAIPSPSHPNTTISVKTGTYFEILPIVLPSYTALVGDELRSTVIQPQPAIDMLATDKAKTISALERIKAIIPDVIANTAVTPTSGNTQTQDVTLSDGSIGSTVAVDSIVANAELMYDIVNNGIAEIPATVMTAPTGYNTSFLAGYGDAKAQLAANSTYIKAEIAAYLNTNYNAVWTALGVDGQAGCARDIGYILDAIMYDMTYGGNTQSLITGSAYYSFSNLTIGSNELEATVAAYARLKTVVGQIILETDVTESSGNSELQNTLGTPGSAGSATFAQARVQDVIDWIENGSAPATITPTAITIASASLQASYNALQAAKAEIQSDTVAWVKKFYQNIDFDSTTCSRDAGLIVDALSFDALFGTNFNSIIAGRSYHRAIASTAVVLTLQKDAELGAINFIKYKAKAIAGAGASAQAVNAINDIVNTIKGGAVPRYTWPDYTGVDAQDTAAAKLIWQNKEFIKAETIAYITANYPAVVYDQEVCKRDVGLVIDALRYDLTYGGNYASRQAGLAYYTGATLMIAAGEKAATLAAYGNIKTIVQDIANGGLSAYTPLQGSIDYITGTAGDSTSATNVGNLVDAITTTIDTGTAPSETLPSTSWVASTLTSANSALQSAKATIQSSVIAFIDTNFPSLVYNSTTCSRDVGYIIDAIGYDFMMGSNYRSILNGISYYRAQASLVIGNQKEATLAAFNYLKVQIETTLAIYATAKASASKNMQTIINILDKGVGETPEVNGTVSYNNTLGTIRGAEVLRANKAFLANEATAWISSTFAATVTATTASGGVLTTSATHKFVAGDPVVFAGTTIGGITAGVVYYVSTVPSTTTFTLVDVQNVAITVTDDTGSMTVTYSYDSVACQRDMTAYIEAVIEDLIKVGNYRSFRAAQLYNNAVKGSNKENMFLVANGSGLRNCTLSGLYGTLTNANEFGTKRPTAGAFVALNPGFGPNDSNVWVMTRSHYSQNVTMFGTGCTGAKIDAALHAGGNKSMVKNDFTTILSDGIGVWCTGSGSLTELVSVFNYYGYSGYLAELGGKIRATNGNSSYGTYGVIAEGVDTYEVPKYGTVNNQYNDAQVGLTITDSTTQILRLEYSNAGSNYTNNIPTISGSGYNAVAVGDEFRDGALFEARIIDKNDGQGVGGTNYVSFANAAQEGQLGSITIAATDTTLTDGYNGMRIQLTAGTGVGQYANILSYLNGSKVAKVYKDSFTTLTATATTSSGNYVTVSSNATLYVNMPIYFSGTTIGGITAGTLYYVKGFNSTNQFTISESSSGGTPGTTVTLTTDSGSMSVLAAGWDHVVPGRATQNVLDLTTAYIIEPRISLTAPGFTTSAGTITSGNWSSITSGNGYFVAVGNTASRYSTNGTSWTDAGALPSASWIDTIYGGGHDAVGTAVVGGLGGTGAVLVAELGEANTTGAALADQVARVTVINGGQNYTTAPTIVFTSSSGTGAVATCTVLDGKIKTVTVTIPGSGYTSTPTVAAVTDRLTSITVNAWGRDYFSTPTVTVDYPAGLTPTAWASLTSVLVGDKLVTTDGNIYNVTGAGTTATTKPVHTTGSTTNGSATLEWIAAQAVVTATLTNNGVSGYTFSNYGAGYTVTPSVTITDPAAKFVAIAIDSNNAYYQTIDSLGSAWTACTTNTGKTDLRSVAYGAGTYVAVGGASGTASAVSSTDGLTWINRSSAITDLGGTGYYSSVAYGAGVFVAISYDNNKTSYSTNGVTWTAGGTLPANTFWTQVAYGNGRFVAITEAGTTSGATVAYSVDNGVTWSAPAAGIGQSSAWESITYGQGVFLVTGGNGSSEAATSPDGINWTARTLSAVGDWNTVFGTVNKKPLFLSVDIGVAKSATNLTYTGAQALGRIKVAAGIITETRIVEPGSGYSSGVVTASTGSTTDTVTVDNTINLVANQPVEFVGCSAAGLAENVTYYVVSGSITTTAFKVSATAGGTALDLTTATGLTGTYRAGPIWTITDPNNVRDVALRMRMGDGALGNPSFLNRGADNATATAIIQGDGFGDLYQPSTFLNVANLYELPVAGANVEFASLPGVYFKLVTVTNVLGSAGNYTAQFQINPGLTVLQAPAQNDVITTRLAYSQVRLTGHDFLYIGTGNQTRTNYPFVDPSTAIQANQTNSSGGGRVFFTSTDQDGNFNVGNLFGVQQATGTATLNASAFNLSGLNSLQLGAVSIGVGSAIINQFSTDPYFTANSDNIVPTQRAIKAYITAQIGGGSSSLNVNTLTSGVIYVANNTISTTSGQQINVTSKMNFTGGIDGAPVALGFFMQR